MPYCSKCGREYNDDRKYCTKCGSPLYKEKSKNESFTQTSYTASHSEPKATAYTYSPEHKQNVNYTKDEDTQPVSIAVYILSLILFSIPVLGFLVCLVWACGGVNNKNLLNYSRAVLILMCIGTVIAIVGVIIAAASPNAAIAGFINRLFRLFI